MAPACKHPRSSGMAGTRTAKTEWARLPAPNTRTHARTAIKTARHIVRACAIRSTNQQEHHMAIVGWVNPNSRAPGRRGFAENVPVSSKATKRYGSQGSKSDFPEASTGENPVRQVE